VIRAAVDGVALGITAAGLVASAVALSATRRLRFALKVLLDFLLAAGLLRLTGQPGWAELGTAAAVVAVRRLVGIGLRAGRPGTSGG
jgi:uncharacterized membrane protein